MRPLSFWLCICVPLVSAATPSRKDEIIDDTFPVIQTSSSSHLFNEEAIYFPDDIWFKFCDRLDGPTLWNMGLVNKHLGALLRSPVGFRDILKALPPFELLDILESSDLKIYSYHLDLFRESVGWATSWTLKQPRFTGHNILTMAYSLTARLQEKAGDWDAFYYFLTKFSGTTNFNAACLGQAFADHLWGSNNLMPWEMKLGFQMMHQDYFLPEPSDRRLFDWMDAKFVTRITFSTGARYRCMFLPLLMSDYLLPCFRGELLVSPYEKGCLRLIFKHCSFWFQPYFSHLMLALYQLTGSVEKSEPTLIEPICSFLEDFGFVWKKIMPRIVSIKHWQALLNQKDSSSTKLMHAVAIQWNLDVNEDGVDTQQLGKCSAKNMRYLMCQLTSMNHSKMKKMHLLDGQIVTETSPQYQETLKRKREEETGTEDKRPRLDGPSINLRKAQDGSKK